MPGLQPAADDVTGQHPVDREVLADVAEEVEGAERLGPVEVVDHRRGAVAVEVDEPGDLVADALDPLGDRLLGVHDPLPRFLGVADEAGGAADQQQRAVAGELEPARGEDLQEVADVQARRRRVEPDVEREWARRQRVAQRVAIRRVRDEAAGVEVVEDVSHCCSWIGCAPILAHRGGARVAAVGRHAGLVREPEPPGDVGGPGDADAWAAEHDLGYRRPRGRGGRRRRPAGRCRGRRA